MNSLFQQLNQTKTNPIISNVKQMMNDFKSASNPNLMLQNMINQNPQMKQAIEFVQKSGGDSKTAFYKLAEMKGVNPEEVLNALK